MEQTGWLIFTVTERFDGNTARKLFSTVSPVTSGSVSSLKHENRSVDAQLLFIKTFYKNFQEFSVCVFFSSSAKLARRRGLWRH